MVMLRFHGSRAKHRFQRFFQTLACKQLRRHTHHLQRQQQQSLTLWQQVILLHFIQTVILLMLNMLGEIRVRLVGEQFYAFITGGSRMARARELHIEQSVALQQKSYDQMERLISVLEDLRDISRQQLQLQLGNVVIQYTNTGEAMQQLSPAAGHAVCHTENTYRCSTTKVFTCSRVFISLFVKMRIVNLRKCGVDQLSSQQNSRVRSVYCSIVILWLTLSIISCHVYVQLFHNVVVDAVVVQTCHRHNYLANFARSVTQCAYNQQFVVSMFLNILSQAQGTSCMAYHCLYLLLELLIFTC